MARNVFETNVRLRFIELSFGHITPHFFGNLPQLLHLLPLRNLPKRRRDARDGLMARKAEVDEPLPVETASH